MSLLEDSLNELKTLLKIAITDHENAVLLQSTAPRSTASMGQAVVDSGNRIAALDKEINILNFQKNLASNQSILDNLNRLGPV